MQAELAVFGALSDALSAEDPQRIRELVDQHRERFVDDPEHMRAGYSILADCLEFESAAVTARAQRFYDRERASTLRRKIRKTCL